MQPPAISRPIRCVTIDVEEYFHIEAAHGFIARRDWDSLPSRVECNVELLLDLFARHDVRATFFFLGWIGQRHPHLVRRCADAGHEIASHGSHHDRLHRLTPATFREDALDSKRLLEDLAGAPVLGYRAPTWSITRDTAWALDALAHCGFTYDASIFPVFHPWYGVPDAPTRPFLAQSQPDGAKLLEVPPLIWRTMNRNLAVAGGGYFRLLPLSLMRAGLRQAAHEARPAVLYFHPWEFDPDTPPMPLPLTGRVRTYTGLRTAADRFDRVLREFQGWTTIAGALGALHAIAADHPPFSLHPVAATSASTPLAA